ncbi:MAG: PfaD family polyunsaturated fatty acid/polyketide biosynthesis protein [Myxococcota bacterium]
MARWFGVGVGDALARLGHPLEVVRLPGGGAAVRSDHADPGQLLGRLPPIAPETLGDPSFLAAHGVRAPYVTGSMANGIASVELVRAAAAAGFLGFFGAAGLALPAVEAALAGLAPTPGPWGANLIHAPNEPGAEQQVAEAFVRHGVRFVEVSAFIRPTPAVVWLASHGARVSPAGEIVRPRAIFAKVSHPEVARPFVSPAPADVVRALVSAGRLTEDEGRLALRVPLATDLTVEADSGGHTDNRPLVALFPSIRAVRDAVEAATGIEGPRLGAAGGLGDPAGIAAAFALGAGYVLTGSVNQAAVECGLSADGRALLATAGIADFAMAAAADMFEQGVRVQVLRRGTQFAQRANRLYEVYRAHPSLEALPPAVRDELERRVLGATLGEVWEQTRAFFAQRDPSQLTAAESDPRHQMALTFRWYLGRSSRWAIDGDRSRQSDWQIWCGPAMGAFNTWTAGTYLADPARRTVADIGVNLLRGAAVATRAHQLRTFGVPVPRGADLAPPRPLGDPS